MKRKLPFKLKMGILNLIFLFLFVEFANSQKITGIITDSKSGDGLPGVSIMVKGTSQGTISDVQGHYSLEVNSPNAKLLFSFVGYVSQEVSIESSTQINVSLVEDITKMDEIVVVGYGTQKKRDLTGSVTVVSVDDMTKVTSNNFAKLIQGQASGVQVHTSGEPGADPVVNIRGIGSFTSAGPLYVIDGVPLGGIADFSPSDIETMQILKDAASCAIYGARGANGVIIITTKQGKKGNLRASYEGSFGWQNIAKRMKVTDREQFQTMNNLARSNNDEDLAPANDPTNAYYITDINTDWQKEAFKTGNIVNHTLTLSGGSDNNTYAANIDYFQQSGTLKGPGPKYTRYSFRLNSSQKSDKFKFGQSVYYAYSHKINLEDSQWGNPILNVITCIPTVPVYDSSNPDNYGYGAPSDTLQDQISANEIAYNNIKRYYSNRNRFTGNIWAEYEIIKGLTYKISLSYNRTDWFDHEFIPTYNLGRDINAIAYLKEIRGENPYMIAEHTLTYNAEIGKHSLTVLAGYTAQKDFWNRVYGYAEGYTEPYFEELTAGTSGQTTLGEKYEHRLLSYLGRINYSYNDKYLLTANIRRDYSSRFGPNKKYGDFPSLSLGWKINNEAFLKDYTFIDLIKFRASYGVLGNENIGDYKYETTMNNNASYVFSGTLNAGTTQINEVDPSIHWEQNTTKNIGVDVALFRNKLEFSAEYYHNNATDLLLELPIPWSVGSLTNPTTNAASMTNQGFEFSIKFRKSEGDFHYEIGGNIATLKNKVTKTGTLDDPITTSISQTAVGHSMGELYGYVYEGVFQNTDEINKVSTTSSKYDNTKHAFQTVYTTAGDCKFKDLNGDGIVNTSDRTYLGVAFPKLSGGVNINMDYKGIDLSVFLQGVYGNKVYNGEYAALNAYSTGNYSIESYNNYWRGEGTSTKYPRMTAEDYNSNNRVSGRFIQDGSYLRVQSVQLGYTLPKSILNIPAIKNFRVYGSAQNLFTFTKYTGFDPDFTNDGYLWRAQDNGSYPNPRTFMLGLKATF